MQLNKIIETIKSRGKTTPVYYLETDESYCNEHVNDLYWFILHTQAICVAPCKDSIILLLYRTKELRDKAFVLAKERYEGAVRLVEDTVEISKSIVDEYDRQYEYAKWSSRNRI